MRTTPLLLLLAVAGAALIACSPQQGARPAPVARYGPTSQSAPTQPARYAAQPARAAAGQPYPCAAPGTPATYSTSPVRVPPLVAPVGRSAPVRTQAAPTAVPVARAAPTRMATAPSYPTASGPFLWHTRLADAQAQARRENKYVLVGSTQTGCSLCVKFKNQIVPQAGSRVSSVAVGYMLDLSARNPEAPAVWGTLKSRLGSGGNLMPLVGIFTPDMQYITGFGGPTDLNELLGALSTAQRMRPVAAPAPQRAFPRRSPGSAQVAPGTAGRNEYGEYEWTPLGQLYPQPVDALGPEAGRPVPDALPAGTPVLAQAQPVVPAGTPAILPAPTRVPAGVTASVRPTPVRPTPVRPTPVRPTPVRIAAPTPVVAAAPKPVAAPAPRPPFHREPEPATETWARNALRQALQQIQSGDLDAAKTTLAQVHARLPGTTLAREAAKGTVAVYNAERIRSAEGRERDRLRAEAHRNLQASMWGVLFVS